MDINDAVSGFIKGLKRRGYSKRTLDAYDFDLKQFQAFLSEKYNFSGEKLDINMLDKQCIRAWIDFSLENGNTPKTVARKVATLKSFFKYHLEEGTLRADPAQNIPIPKSRKKLPRSLSQDEIFQLLDAPDPESPNFLRDRAILALMYGTGLRVSELVSLNMEQAHLDLRTLRLEGKGAKERIVPLPDSVLTLLIDYYSQREKELPETVSPRSPAFITRHGKRMTVRMIQYMVQQYGLKAGIASHVHPHLIRHSIASHLVDEGCHIEAVRQTLGHEDLSTTSIYLKTATRFLKSEHEKFNPSDRIIKR